MRNGLLGSIAALAASAGLAFGQSPKLSPGRPAAPVSAGPSAVVSAIPAGTMPAAYEPLAAAPPVETGYAGSPALEMLGPQGPGEGDGSRSITRAWVEGEYLLWGVRSGPSTFPLIVTGTVQQGANPLAPGAVVNFGGGNIDWGLISGSRIRGGFLFPGSNRIGLEAEGIILPRKQVVGAAASGPLGLPVIGRPFVNELTGAIDSVLAASPANPGRADGAANTMLWTAELNIYANLFRSRYFSLSAITGFKHFDLTEGIRVSTSRTIGSAGQTFLGRPLAIGSVTSTEDRFDTANRFYGWELGLDFEYKYRCWSLSGGFHNAIGNNNESVDVNGFSQTITGPAAARVTTQVPGGVLAGLTNIGRQARDEFTVVPEARLELGYQLTSCARVTCGYTFVYASNVARPGRQIDPVVNPTIVPFRPEYGLNLGGTARPLKIFRASEYYADGVNWSLVLTY